jgi:hypothetical protein
VSIRGTATLVKHLGHPGADQRLYKLSYPIDGERYDDDCNPITKSWAYVVVSGASVIFSGPETYIFGSDESGKILDWTELGGSFRGDIDHIRALTGAGYSVVE